MRSLSVCSVTDPLITVLLILSPSSHSHRLEAATIQPGLREGRINDAGSQVIQASFPLAESASESARSAWDLSTDPH